MNLSYDVILKICMACGSAIEYVSFTSSILDILVPRSFFFWFLGIVEYPTDVFVLLNSFRVELCVFCIALGGITVGYFLIYISTTEFILQFLYWILKNQEIIILKQWIFPYFRLFKLLEIG